MKYSVLILIIFTLIGCIGDYTPTTYMVYYHDNGATSGTSPVDTKSYYSGGSATVMGEGNLENNDYLFLGWRYYTTLYNPGDFISINHSDINFYAVWDDGLNSPFSFKIVNNEAIITRYNEYSHSIVIPNTLQSKPVTAINNTVFSNLSISSVVFSDNLKSIGINAFANNWITNIIITDSIETIGLAAFRDNRLVKVTLGNGIKTISPSTFANNNLKDITIPANVTFVGSGAFSGNDIELIIIGSNVEISNNTSLGTYGESFLTKYNNEEKAAGTYIYTGDDTWEWF